VRKNASRYLEVCCQPAFDHDLEVDAASKPALLDAATARHVGWQRSPQDSDRAPLRNPHEAAKLRSHFMQGEDCLWVDTIRNAPGWSSDGCLHRLDRSEEECIDGWQGSLQDANAH
jgi:hypothetical protein